MNGDLNSGGGGEKSIIKTKMFKRSTRRVCTLSSHCHSVRHTMLVRKTPLESAVLRVSVMFMFMTSVSKRRSTSAITRRAVLKKIRIDVRYRYYWWFFFPFPLTCQWCRKPHGCIKYVRLRFAESFFGHYGPRGRDAAGGGGDGWRWHEGEKHQVSASFDTGFLREIWLVLCVEV